MYTRGYKYKYNYKWYIPFQAPSRIWGILPSKLYTSNTRNTSSSLLQSLYICASNLDTSLETNKDKKCILLQIPTIRQNLGLVPSFLIRCRLCNMYNVQCNMYNIKTKCIWSKFPQSNKSMNGLAGNLLIWVQSPTSLSSTLGCIIPAFKENSGLDNWFFWIPEPHC